MKQIQSVTEYNRGAMTRYRRDIDAWDASRGGFPFMGFYVYSREDTGELYKRGTVVSWEHAEGGKGSRLFHKREEARAFYNSLSI